MELTDENPEGLRRSPSPPYADRMDTAKPDLEDGIRRSDTYGPDSFSSEIRGLAFHSPSSTGTTITSKDTNTVTLNDRKDLGKKNNVKRYQIRSRATPYSDHENQRLVTFTPPRPVAKKYSHFPGPTRTTRFNSDSSGDSIIKAIGGDSSFIDDVIADVQPYSQSLPSYLATHSFFGLRPHSESVHSSEIKLEHTVVGAPPSSRTFMSPPSSASFSPSLETGAHVSFGGVTTEQLSLGLKSDSFPSSNPDKASEERPSRKLISSLSTMLHTSERNRDATGNELSNPMQHAIPVDKSSDNCHCTTTTNNTHHNHSNNHNQQQHNHHQHQQQDGQCTDMSEQQQDVKNFNPDLNQSSTASSPPPAPTREDSRRPASLVLDQDTLEEDSSPFQTPREMWQEAGTDRYLWNRSGEKEKMELAVNAAQTKQKTCADEAGEGWDPRFTNRRRLIKRKSEVLLSLEGSVETEDTIGEAGRMDGTGLQDRIDDKCDDAGEKNKKDDNRFVRGHEERGRGEVPCSPRTPKARRTGTWDPYHIFQVQTAPCLILRVRVLCGRNITLGLRDYYDTPDPYVYLHVPTSPEGRKYTSIKDDTPNPVWNEDFTFYINFAQNNILEIRLMESNAMWFDMEVGTLFFDVCNIREMDVVQRETFVFNEVCEVDMEFFLEFDKNPTLRYSLCLSEAEKDFQEARRRRVMEGVRNLLGEKDGPRTVEEVPTVAVIGSGGGFRAMTAYCGVFKALVESGVLDCVSYAGGLSGSSWLLSTIYSHPDWPRLDMDKFLDEMMNNVDKNLRRFLHPTTLYNFAKQIVHKRKEGQPVSFTDLFGRMVGETLLPERMDATLSDQREKTKDGLSPLPLYTCVHVKKDVPARSFQEWVEFSPYEIGMPKYGTFMDTSLFGSKFFMGKLVKQYQEQPLHFLQGIWGSAFCILFKRLLEDNRRIDPAEIIRQELGDELEDLQNEVSSDCSDDDDDDSPDTSLDSTDSSNDVMKISQESVSDESMDSQCPPSEGDSAVGDDDDDDDDTDSDEDESRDKVRIPFANVMKGSLEKEQENGKVSTDESGTLKGIVRTNSCAQDWNQSDDRKKSVNWGHCPARESTEKRKKYARSSLSMRKSRSGSKSYWKTILKSLFESDNLLNSREGRAAVIHNFMRGLSLEQTYPLSPFTPVQDRVQAGDEFDGIFEMHPTSVKNIYMVDAGLTFNSPYPLVLRPQREVDIILSFDFSARPSDNHQPFKELLLAEKWARLNRLPFPPIDLSEYEKDGMKELYVFRDPNNPHCPVVFHFVLVNKTFRYYSRPGVKRQTKEEFDFANFDIFDDPDAPYSTFNFTYTHESFQRLTKLMEFNTLLHLEDIKKAIGEIVLKKRENPNRYNIDPKEKFLLSMKSSWDIKKKMRTFIQRLGSVRGSVSYTPTPDTATSGNPFFSGYNRELSVGSSVDGSVYGTPRESLPDFPNFSGDIDSPDNKSRKRPPSLLPFATGSSDQIRDQNQTPCSGSSPRGPLSSSPSSSLPYKTPPMSGAPHEPSSFPIHYSSFGFSENSQTSFDTPQPSQSLHENHRPHPPTDSTSLHNTPPTSTNIGSDTGVTAHTNPSTSSTPSSDQTSFLHLKKEKSRNIFFANMSFSNSSSSSGNTDSPSSAKLRFTNVAKMQMKKNRHKYLKHPDSPLIQSAIALGKDKFSLRKYQQKKEAVMLAMSKQSPLVSSPNSGTIHPEGKTEVPQPPSPQRYVSQPSSDDNFTLAPQAFQADGTPVFDSREAKMYYDEVKLKRRKMLRRQSTISSLNSMSLDEIQEYYHDALEEPDSTATQSVQSSNDSGYNSLPSTQHQHQSSLVTDNPSLSLTSSSGLKNDEINFQDLSQFEASTDQDMRSVQIRDEVVPESS